MGLFRIISRIAHVLGIDPAVGFLLVGNALVGLLAAAQMALIVRRFSPDEQGIHFNYLNFFSYFEFIDFGFAVVVQQIRKPLVG